MEAVVLYSLFVYFWYHLIGQSDILAKPRAWLIRLVGPHLSYPLSCGFCFSFWMGIALLLSPVYVPVGWLAMLFVVPVVNLVLDLVVRKMRHDVQPPTLLKADNAAILNLLDSWQNDDKVRERMIAEVAQSMATPKLMRESGWMTDSTLSNGTVIQLERPLAYLHYGATGKDKDGNVYIYTNRDESEYGTSGVWKWSKTPTKWQIREAAVTQENGGVDEAIRQYQAGTKPGWKS